MKNKIFLNLTYAHKFEGKANEITYAPSTITAILDSELGFDSDEDEGNLRKIFGFLHDPIMKHHYKTELESGKPKPRMTPAEFCEYCIEQDESLLLQLLFALATGKMQVNLSELNNANNPYIVDRKTLTNITLPNGSTSGTIKWYQFRIPLTAYTNAVGGISDFRSVRFSRLYLKDFTQTTVFRFGTFDLVRSDWRRFQQSLDDDSDAATLLEPTAFSVGIVGIQENDGSYVSPPDVQREQLNNNNTIVRQNEQSLVVDVCDLESQDARAVFKNINVDMRQYKKIKMFLHAEDGEANSFQQGDLVAFVRMGNDFTQNYYQLELPLRKSSGAIGSSESEVWPEFNEINIPLELLEQIKSTGINQGTLTNEDPIFYNVIDGELQETPVTEFTPFSLTSSSSQTEAPYEQRIAIKGNPNFGDIRTLMIGVKNIGNNDLCAEVWFNELRIADMDNEGGWAAMMSMDSNIADFMNVNATAKRSTTGFGNLDQGPNERSREDLKQYDVVTNMNLGQLLPKKWGFQIPFNYGLGETLITPEYDQQYKDLKLESRLDAAENSEERERILNFKGTQSIKLSNNILRSETAVISALSIVNFLKN